MDEYSTNVNLVKPHTLLFGKFTMKNQELTDIAIYNKMNRHKIYKYDIKKLYQLYFEIFYYEKMVLNNFSCTNFILHLLNHQ